MEDNKLNSEFWSEIKEKFVGEIQEFNQWIEKYKTRMGWEHIFNPNYTMEGMSWRRITFYDLPDAMQIGIFIQYVSESGSRYGIELPSIERQKDFEKIKQVIYDFFFHEYDNIRQEHLEGKFMNDSDN
jgi:hypothetical protein